MKKLTIAAMVGLTMTACSPQGGTTDAASSQTVVAEGEADGPTWSLDRFADIEVLRYEVPGFENLTLQQKQLIYHLSEAALWGRDILWDQNCRYNLPLRRLLEAVYTRYEGSRDNPDWLAFETYFKQIEFANGIHHHYSTSKFVPRFGDEWLTAQINAMEDKDSFFKTVPAQELKRVIFDSTYMAVRVNQADGQDLVTSSAGNFYRGVTQAEVEAFYAKMKRPGDPTPVMYGLNSQLAKENGRIVERKWTATGMYGSAITHIVEHLEAALPFAETPEQRSVIEKLVEYYRSGDLKDFDAYSIAWVKDLASRVDFINGFIESYGDPLGLRGSWEAMVNFKDSANTARTQVISENAQWFEDRSPVDPRFRKPVVVGVSAKVITAAILAGDTYPSTPIGINLPNSNWIRAQHGSKSVTIDNITYAYDRAAQGNGFGEEFRWSAEEVEMAQKYGYISDNVHTDLHECLGHASGQLLPGTDPDALKAYGSPLEEGRADLFALYYIADPKLVELGVLPDMEAYKAQYYSYMMNGLMTQLVRIEPGATIEEAHMRNRAFIARWVYEQAQIKAQGPSAVPAVEMRKRDGKTYVVVNDYERLRRLFGLLLAEVQRIKSEGDYEAGRRLVEDYGVKVDPELHAEVLERYKALNLAPYKGFVNPRYELVKDSAGNVTDVRIVYGEGFVDQVLRYSRDYAGLAN